MREIPNIITADSRISSLERDKKDNLIKITSKTPLNDYQKGAISEGKDYITGLRSGYAQAGLDLKASPNDQNYIEGDQLYVKNQEIKVVNPLLEDALQHFNIGDEVGRVVVLDPELRIKDINHFIHKKIFIDTPFEIKEECCSQTGEYCHYVEASLLDMKYHFEKHAISAVSVNRIVKEGRSAIDKIRSEINGINLAEEVLNPGDFFVGAIKVSLGDVVGVIDFDVEPSEAGVKQLPAIALDPFRTSKVRQIELLHTGSEPISLDQIRIKIRFYKANNPLKIPLSWEKVRNGYRTTDLITSEELNDLFNKYDLSFSSQSKEPHADSKNAGLILNKRNVVPVPQTLNPEAPAQLEVIKNCLAESTEKKKVATDSSQEKNPISEKLAVIGGVNSKIWVSDIFPNQETLNVLRSREVRTFLTDQTNIFLSDSYFKTMVELTHKIKDPCEFLRFDREVQKLLTFHHGFFMEAQDKERFDKVRYWFAFYGSHKEGTDEKLTMDFLYGLADYYNGSMGILQGSGPGLMAEANNLARAKNVFSGGVALNLAYDNQDAITSCDGFAGFFSGQRHARQHVMDKLASFPIINVGGFGTLEEIGTTITSLKLNENPLGPIVFLDPEGHWHDVQKQIQKIAKDGWGQDYIPQLCIPVSTAEEGIKAIQEFTNSPSEWYENRKIPQKAIQEAREKAEMIRHENLGLKNSELFKTPFK